MKIKDVHLPHGIRKSIPRGTCCEECNVGRERNCSHWNGRHYDVWGEGLSLPDYCPQKEPPEGLPF